MGLLKYVFRWRSKWFGHRPAFTRGTFTAFGRTFTYAFGWKMENARFFMPVFKLR